MARSGTGPGPAGRRCLTLATCLIVSGGAAIADDGWDAFESLCLTPFEAVEPVSEVSDRGSAWTLTKTSCALSVAVPDDGFDRWAEAQLASGRYVRDADESDGTSAAYLSTDWREPRLRVRATRQVTGVIYSVEETEFEA